MQLTSQHTALYSKNIVKPVALRKAEIFNHLNNVRVDHYHWLRDRSNPMFTEYLDAENAYTDAVMEPTLSLQQQLFDELRSRIQEEDISVPCYYNGYHYYWRSLEGMQYRVYCRKKASQGLQNDISSEGVNAEKTNSVEVSSEEVLFDANAMAHGTDTFLFGGYEISPDNRMAAWLSNETGSYAEFTLRIRDLESGTDLSGVCIEHVQDVVWSNNNDTLFYSICNEALRPYKVMRIELSNLQAGAQSVFQEDDELFIVNLHKTKSNAFIMVSCGSFSTSEYHILDANNPLEPLKMFLPREKDTDYGVYHHTDKFLVQLKDKLSLNGKVYEAPLAGFENRKNWKEIIAHDPNVMIDYLDLYQDYFVVQMHTNGLAIMQVRALDGTILHVVSFPEPVYSAEVLPLQDFNSEKFRYNYTSLNRPVTVYEFYPAKGTTKKIKETVIPCGFNADDYAVERLYADATDGTRVPMALLYKKDKKNAAGNPTLLYGYGAYGCGTEARFYSSFFSLVDRGFVFAIAQVRGGDELGEQWYEDGKLLKKQNSFTDFIACSEKLIADGFTAPGKLNIMGGSAGGLLVTAAANMRPDLFNSVVALVPFVDVVNTMLDPSLPLTVQEYEEWGNPNDVDYFACMLSYSPYDNIGTFDYPHMLVTAGLNDSQVGYHEPAKYVAKLRTYQTNDSVVLLKTNMQSGHGGATGRFDQLKESAFELAFILDRTAMTVPQE